MRRVQGFGGVSDPCARARKGQRAFFQHAVQRQAFNVFHHQIRSLSGLLDSHVVQGDHVGMGELANDASFAQKSIASFALSQIRRKNLDRDRATNHRVKTANHAAGGAYAESFEQLVSSDLHGDLPF